MPPIPFKSDRLLEQKRGDKNKLFSMRAPEVECIGKGKVRHPYEFGVKVSVTVTHKEGLVVGMKSRPGNPYDSYNSLEGALKQVGELTDKLPKAVFVDKGYQGVEIADTQIWRSGQKHGVTASIRKAIHRRSMLEPMIGHMKSEGRLGRNWLQGAAGDAIHAVLCGAGHSLRMILRALRLFWVFIGVALLDCIVVTGWIARFARRMAELQLALHPKKRTLHRVQLRFLGLFKIDYLLAKSIN